MKWESKGHLPRGYPKVVSYHTSAFYARDAFQLARTCLLHGLAYSIESVSDLGSWAKNTSHKPTFLRRKHDEDPDRNLLWVDADARIWCRPDQLSCIEATIGYHRWKGREALSGTVYLGNHDGMLGALLDAWIAECAKFPHATDQVCMERAVAKVPGATFRELPVELCSIFDGVGQLRAPEENHPTIEHFQSSRFTKGARA